LAVDAFLLLRGFAFVDLQAPQPDVAHAVERQRVGGKTVPPGAADLLVIALDVGRHVGVKDEADIRFVDPHPERHRRHHDDFVLLQEHILVARTHGRLHAGMIPERLCSALPQHLGEFFCLAPRGAIDDAALAVMGLDEIRDLPAAGRFGLHRQAQVRPIEAVDEHGWRATKKLLQDIRTGSGIGGGREGDGLHPAKRGLHRAERGVFRTKIVTPLRNAVRLVDRKQRDRGALEEIEGFRFHQTFGRDIEEAQLATGDAVEDRAVLGGIVCGVERSRRDAIAAQLRHLVAHERDQRRHDDSQAVVKKRRKLIAQRLAASGRHDRQHVTAVEDGRDDLALPRPEPLEAESRAKNALRRREVRHMRTLPRPGSIFVLASPQAPVRSHNREHRRGGHAL
jgi:hypothetical protein